ncbi:hypothetical protein D9619_005224 [Psilocybe cf. subviscida]|uniref:Uncharacterized protein n=1 Tax=Psilocybe cf. subviscida TaxID=2480587 RepID=A0A8H5BX78_9AGAR|nr:hypothetical protein D9619_005224 [Psilocybe cf. subviscida]
MSVTVIEESQLIPTLDILFAEQCRLPPSSTASSEPPSPSPLSDSTPSQNELMSQLASSTSTHTTASASASASASPSASPSASASTSSLPAPARSIKFAPLPELGPRKRRSNAPLGMAARGALARRRRPSGAGLGGGVVIVAVAGTGAADIPPDVPPENIRYVTPAEFEAHRMQQEAMAARYAQHQGLAAALAARQLEAEQEAEFEREEREREMERAAQEEARATGKKVKLGKKGFWKRVVHHRESESSLKDAQVAAVNVTPRKVERDNSLRRTKSDLQKSATTPPSQTSPSPLPPLRPILATVKSEPLTNTGTTEKTAKNLECCAPPTGVILPILTHTEGDVVDDGPQPPHKPPAADAAMVVTTEDSDTPIPPTDDLSRTPTPEIPADADDTKANDDP